jgi:NADH-quinone oxidoreductase subunit A
MRIEGARIPLSKPGGVLNLGAMQVEQIEQYVPVLMLLGLALGFTAFMLVGSVLVGKLGKRSPAKDTPYECGKVPVGAGAPRLSVRFYLVAMLFILFDIEVVFLYPWAVVFRRLLKDPATANLAFFSMLSFIAILFVGYVYAVNKRAFDWKR